ncbi:histidinol phosphate phosphatase domain-containing protein [Desulfoluna butyratoxydans]|uniref:Polymerase/histidinol phosphatase-like n=1 Tax=Desulfoluna butyratoxydans TaxID=231438 RepID=A0A4U8YR76_9BACT|nr:histidinol phosphate phosphatase domain-containing protein [Desulfoluna butyratoxydans]VFQ46224.1 polymerase/histidinol phosphatase-like [Desulfoluna butyratoxydans]
MIDLHSHTFFSDGVLVPSELARRAEAKGLTALGITDHGDLSNIDHIVPRIVAVADRLNDVMDIEVVPGIELTHVPPAHIAEAAALARKLGARIVVVHGETVVEPVAPGTNRAAIEAKVDVLAHPGLITDEEAALAAANGVLLEITARGGHSLTNGHVAQKALKAGASMVIDTDSHSPGDLIDEAFARIVIAGAGLPESAFEQMQANARAFLTRG